MQPKKPTAESLLAPKKQYLSEEEFLELWDTRGLKYRWDELHKMLLDRGLGVYVDRPIFRRMVYNILHAFLVDGEARRDPKHEIRTEFPKVF